MLGFPETDILSETGVKREGFGASSLNSSPPIEWIVEPGAGVGVYEKHGGSIERRNKGSFATLPFNLPLLDRRPGIRIEPLNCSIFARWKVDD